MSGIDEHHLIKIARAATGRLELDQAQRDLSRRNPRTEVEGSGHNNGTSEAAAVPNHPTPSSGLPCVGGATDQHFQKTLYLFLLMKAKRAEETGITIPKDESNGEPYMEAELKRFFKKQDLFPCDAAEMDILEIPRVERCGKAFAWAGESSQKALEFEGSSGDVAGLGEEGS